MSKDKKNGGETYSTHPESPKDTSRNTTHMTTILDLRRPGIIAHLAQLQHGTVAHRLGQFGVADQIPQSLSVGFGLLKGFPLRVVSNDADVEEAAEIEFARALGGCHVERECVVDGGRKARGQSDRRLRKRLLSSLRGFCAERVFESNASCCSSRCWLGTDELEIPAIFLDPRLSCLFGRLWLKWNFRSRSNS